MTIAICCICHKPIGTDENPGAEQSHMACAMESVYGAHGKDPADGTHADAYKRACEKRAEQVGD